MLPQPALHIRFPGLRDGIAGAGAQLGGSSDNILAKDAGGIVAGAGAMVKSTTSLLIPGNALANPSAPTGASANASAAPLAALAAPGASPVAALTGALSGSASGSASSSALAPLTGLLGNLGKH